MSADGHISENDFKRLIRAVGDEVEGRIPKLLATQFELLGIDITTPESRARFRSDQAFVSGMRMGADSMKRGFMKRTGDALAGGLIAIASLIAGLALWNGKPPLH